MISVILYGRNDNHGYNGHKRVALSINAIAHVLDSPQSEIIFVDYNTLDEFPSLPEAIADTLTLTAKKRLRVLRVRPEIHARYAARTHLPVLEPIARNVALRRSNPRNRWILSTNADNILVPRDSTSLCAQAATLEDGFYGLPRFEVPEGLWESLDRRDVEGTIDALTRWGKAAHLNEIVLGEADVLYDNPGDFQLALRTDLFSIDGFNEEMLHGWHVDHNLAKRLAISRDRPRDLGQSFYLYHCSHSRQPTATHQRGRTENDAARFVHAVMVDEIASQRDRWGCPADDIEELRVDNSNRLEEALKPMAIAAIKDSTIHFTTESFGNFYYDAHHVLPFVIDQLSTHACTAVIGYAGVRRDAFKFLRRALAELGFVHRLLVPQECAVRLDVVDVADVQLVDHAIFANRPDVFVFEFGLVRDDDGHARDTSVRARLEAHEETALEAVHDLLVSAAKWDSAPATDFGRRPRRFIVVNAIHNRYQPVVERILEAAPAPFSTRLRQGYVSRPGEKPSPDSLADTLARQLGRAEAVSIHELSALYGMISTVLRGGRVPREERVAFAAAAPLALAFLAQGAATAAFGGCEVSIARDRFATLLQPDEALTKDVSCVEARSPPSRRALSGTGSTADWDDARWLRWARELSDRESDVGSALARTAWVWQRAHILFAMDSEGAIGPNTRALALCELPERFIGPLSYNVGSLDVMAAEDFLDASEPAQRVTHQIGYWTAGSLFRSSSVRLRSPADGAPSSGERYQVAVVPHSAAFCRGMKGFAALLERLDAWLNDDATIFIGAEVALLGRLGQERPARAIAGMEGIGQALRTHTGIEPAGGAIDLSILEGDLRLIGQEQDERERQPLFGLARSGDVLWPCVWVFKRKHPASREQWGACVRALLRLSLGDQLPALRIGPLGEWADGHIRAREAPEGGTAFFGPYVLLPEGRYRARLAMKVASHQNSSHVAAVRVEVAAGSKIFASGEASVPAGRRGPTTLDIDFAVAALAEASDFIEIRCWTNGKANILFEKVELAAL